MKGASSENDLDNGRRPISPLAAIGWTLALTLVINLAVTATDAARSGAADDLVNLIACAVLGHSVVVFIMLRIYAPVSPMREALGVRGASPLHVFLSAAAGAGLAPALAKVDELVLRRFPLDGAEAERTERILTSSSTGGRWFLVIAMIVLLPLAEELFYRGMLFGGVKRGRPVGVTVLAITLLFASPRVGQPQFLVSTILLGVTLAWLRAQSGSVASSLAAHAAFMAVPVAPLITGTKPLETFPLAWTAIGAVTAILSLGLGRVLGSRDARAIAARRDDG